MEVLLATGNQHKAEEFQILTSQSEQLNIVAAPHSIDVVEDGQTYFENAFKKAEGYFKEFKRPVLSDDSGIDVESIPDELGIHSARFGGDGLTDKDRAMLLLKKLGDSDKRKAKFTCVLCLYISPDEYYFFEGHLPGKIGKQYQGDGGFGYDPVFHPEKGDSSITIAEQEDWKMKNSHRASALKFLMDFFQTNNCQN